MTDDTLKDQAEEAWGEYAEYVDGEGRGINSEYGKGRTLRAMLGITLRQSPNISLQGPMVSARMLIPLPPLQRRR